MDGGVLHRSVTLAGHDSARGSFVLRDLLMLRDSAADRRGRETLGSALAAERLDAAAAAADGGRTLLDVILEDGGDFWAAPVRQATSFPSGDPPRARVSLMALLEQPDRQCGGGRCVDPSAAAAAAAGGECGTYEAGCCVCMARAKGAAFIPCGHTFCRPCAGELYAKRGRCPLCNAVISKVLNIF